MADTKISALTAATAALLTHELPLNEAGVDKALTVQLIQDLIGAYSKCITGSAHSIASATGTEVTDLRVALPVAGTYRFEYFLLVRSTSATVGLGFAVNFTGSLTKIAYQGTYVATSTTNTTGVADDVANTNTGQWVEGAASKSAGTATATIACGGVAATGSDILYHILGTVVAAGAGDLALWHASESATTTTVEVGSAAMVARMA